MRLKERFSKDERSKRKRAVEYHSSGSSMDSVNVVVYPSQHTTDEAIEPLELIYSNSEQANSSPKRRKWAWGSTAVGSVVGGVFAADEILDTVNTVNTSSLKDMLIGAAIPTAIVVFKHSVEKARTYREVHKVTKEKHKAKINVERGQAIVDENQAKLT